MTDNEQIDKMMYDAEMYQRRLESKEVKMTLYMNTATGSVDTYDGWYYDDNGVQVNAVDRGEVVVVELVDGEYREVAR